MNINNYIRFKPTASGENILLNTNELTPTERKPDENGFYKIQFWIFCNVFGKHFAHGSDQFFVDNEVFFHDVITPIKGDE